MEDLHYCRFIRFCYDQIGFNIMIAPDRLHEECKFYSEITDGEYTGGLKFLFEITWRGQTDQELIDLLIHKYENCEIKSLVEYYNWTHNA